MRSLFTDKRLSWESSCSGVCLIPLSPCRCRHNKNRDELQEWNRERRKESGKTSNGSSLIKVEIPVRNFYIKNLRNLDFFFFRWDSMENRGGKRLTATAGHPERVSGRVPPLPAALGVRSGGCFAAVLPFGWLSERLWASTASPRRSALPRVPVGSAARRSRGFLEQQQHEPCAPVRARPPSRSEPLSVKQRVRPGKDQPRWKLYS